MGSFESGYDYMPGEPASSTLLPLHNHSQFS